jgi:hypothetical protein
MFVFPSSTPWSLCPCQLCITQSPGPYWWAMPKVVLQAYALGTFPQVNGWMSDQVCEHVREDPNWPEILHGVLSHKDIRFRREKNWVTPPADFLRFFSRKCFQFFLPPPPLTDTCARKFPLVSSVHRPRSKDPISEISFLLQIRNKYFAKQIWLLLLGHHFANPISLSDDWKPNNLFTHDKNYN